MRMNMLDGKEKWFWDKVDKTGEHWLWLGAQAARTG